MRQIYGYIDDVRAVITRPAAMREVHALKALAIWECGLVSRERSGGFRLEDIH